MEENEMNQEIQDCAESKVTKLNVKTSFVSKLKKTISNKKFIIGSCICGAVVIAAIIISSIILSAPKVVFSNSIKNTVKGFLNRDEIAPVMSVLKKGSVELNAELENEDAKIEAGGKVYFNKKGLLISDVMFDNGNMSFNGEAYLGLDYMYVNSEELLGDTYGFVAGESESAFENSVFAWTIGDYALDEDTKKIIANYLRAYDDGIYKDMYKDAEKLTDKYIKKLNDLVSKYGEFEKENTTMRFEGERINVRVITLTIYQDAIVSIFEDLYEYILNDEKLENFIVTYGDYFEDALIASGATGVDFDAQVAYDDFLENLEETIDDIDSAENEDSAIVISAVTSKSSAKLLKLTVSTVEDEEVSLNLGSKGIKKTDSIVLKLGNETYTYEIKENSSSAYEAKLVYEYDSEYDDSYDYKGTMFSVDIDKKKDSFKLDMYDGEAVLKGDFDSGLSKTTITVDSLTIDGEKLEKANIRITFKKSDTMQFNSHKINKANVISVDNLTSDDLKNIEEKIYKKQEN